MTHIDPDVLMDCALSFEDSMPPDVSIHLDACPACREELVSLKQVISMTRESADFPLVSPPEHLWPAIASALDAETPPGVSSLSSRRTRTRPVGAVSRAGWWLAAAAVAGVVIGSAATALVVRRDQSAPSPSPVTLASAQLDTLDTKNPLGTARLVRADGKVDLDVQAAGLTPAPDGYLEVWLINTDLTRMVSIGVMQPGAREQTFAVSQELIDQGYVIVDISREAFDDKPTHSGESLVRGALKA